MGRNRGPYPQRRRHTRSPYGKMTKALIGLFAKCGFQIKPIRNAKDLSVRNKAVSQLVSRGWITDWQAQSLRHEAESELRSDPESQNDRPFKKTAPRSVKIIATDGSCKDDMAGSAWIDSDGNSGQIAFQGTCARAELLAILIALEDNPSGNIRILSDSEYSIRAITDWGDEWKRNGWLRHNGSRPRNLDLILEIRLLIDEHEGKVRFEWVKGHNGHPMNEKADRLAVEARIRRITRRPGIQRKAA